MSLTRRALSIAVIALSMCLLGNAQIEDGIISVESTTVMLNVTIADKNGRHVAGLKNDQFKVFEDGVEQPVEFFAAEDTPFAAVILIDTSGSMESRISLARSAAIRFLDGLRASDAAAIYRFDSKVALVQDFSNSRDVTDRIFDLKSYGMTVLNDAIYRAAAELSNRPEKRRAIIVISDGADTQSGRSADAALKAAVAANAVIYTVDMSSPDSAAAQRMQNAAALKKFAERTGGTFVATPGGAAMRDAFAKIVDELGSQYTLAYTPTNTKNDGKWRAIELRVSRPGLTVRTRKGYHSRKQK